LKRRWIKIKTHDIAFRTAHRGGDFFTAFIDLNTESEIFKGMEEIEIPKDIEIEDSKTGKSKIEVDKDSVVIGEFIYFKNNYVNFYFINEILDPFFHRYKAVFFLFIVVVKIY
jgi:hypothetical protein